MSDNYLQPGLPQPAMREGLDLPYWAAAREEKLVCQQCQDCQHWQWGPEFICFRCHSHDVAFKEIAATGTIYSFERVWHPVHPALKEQGAYLVVLVELPQCDSARMVGNLLGDPHQEVEIGAEVCGVFEHHDDGEPPYTLVQWEVV